MAPTGTETLEVRSFDSPHEVRMFQGNGRTEILEIGGKTIGRSVYEPGWRWSTNVKPLAGTPSCRVRHLAYVVSGRIRVTMDDGAEAEAGPGDVVAVPPGHDAAVVGDETCVVLDFGNLEEFARLD
jgi:hypothetical protein